MHQRFGWSLIAAWWLLQTYWTDPKPYDYGMDWSLLCIGFWTHTWQISWDTVQRTQYDSFGYHCGLLFLPGLDVDDHDCSTYHVVDCIAHVTWYELLTPFESRIGFLDPGAVQPCTYQMWHSQCDHTLHAVEES